MYFNLNSIDERNPANFKNRFSDNVVIEKDSYIRLVGATITRKNYVKKIVLGSEARLRLKLNNYDVFDVPIPAGTYTLQEFCDRANALFTNYDAGDTSIGSICAICSFHAFVGGSAEEEVIEFRFKWKGADNDNGFAFHTLMGIDVSYGRYLARDIVGKASANVRSNKSFKSTRLHHTTKPSQWLGSEYSNDATSIFRKYIFYRATRFTKYKIFNG